MNERQQWLEQRRTGIGGSDVSAILGLNKFKTALDLYRDKRGETDLDDGQSEPAYWGTVLEDVVADEYARREGRTVQRVNTMMRHPSHDFAIANIDRAVVRDGKRARWNGVKLLGTDRILECKTANGFAAQQWGEPGSDYVPQPYLVQCQWYMAITDTARTDLAVLIGGQDFRVYRIPRDDELIDILLTEAAAFWQRVQDGIPPDPQSEAEARQRWAEHQQGREIEADEELARIASELGYVKNEIKNLGQREKDLRDRLIPRLEDAEIVTHNGERLLTYRANKPSRKTDWQAVANDAGADQSLIEKHTTDKPGARVLRLA